MKKRVILLLLLSALFWQCTARDIIHVKVSKPACLLTFLLAANDDPDISSTLHVYIKSNLPHRDSADFSRIAKEFSSIALDYSYTISGYPENRIWPRTTFHLISIAAVQAADINDFLQRIVGILSNEDWLKLKKVLAEAEPYYDKMIGIPYGQEIKKQLASLQKYTGKAGGIFTALKTFYGSTWSSDIPFTISIYAIPGAKGQTTATPHSNSIELGIMTQEENPAMSLSLALHEMCHVLYLEQSLSLQQKIDDDFLQNKSPYSMYAYGYFDEALATACGNGWSYKALSGKEMADSWYANDYINGYAHAIYPMVLDYIHAGKALDKAFVGAATTTFEKQFPKAIYNYQNLLNNVSVYVDADDHSQFSAIMLSVKKYFTAHKSGGHYPISDPETMAAVDQAAGTQLFIVHTSNSGSYTILQSKFPQLKEYASGKEGVISFFDANKRPVIIINVKDAARIEKALSMMAMAKEMNPDSAFMPLE